MARIYTYEEEPWNVVRKQLVRIIKESGVSIGSLCQSASLDKSNVHNYLLGHSTTRIDTLERLCETLGVDIILINRRDNESKH